MKESDAVLLVLDTLEPVLSALTPAVPLTTAGQNDDVTVPSVVLENWGGFRLRHRNGARNYAGVVVDAQGNETGVEQHIYYRASFDLIARHTDEKSRDDLLSTIRGAFLQYEDDPKALHADVSEVSVGPITPRADPFREPDWYQGGVELSFVFVERVTVSGSTLGSVTQNVDVTNAGVSSDDEDATWIGRNL